MERDGLIAREVRGKRTYRITLADGASAARVGLAAGPTAIRQGPAAVPGPGVRAGLGGEGPRLAATTAAAGAPGFDYDELARRLLVQVVRRLAATPAVQQTVAALELELATASTRHGTLTAENVRLREQLVRTQRDLDLARELTRKAAASDELSEAEVVLLEGLLTQEPNSEGQESGATAS
jgi:hypothetical protein